MDREEVFLHLSAENKLEVAIVSEKFSLYLVHEYHNAI